MPTYEETGDAPVLGRGVRRTVLAMGGCSVVIGVATVTWPDKSLGAVGNLFMFSLLCGAVSLAAVALGSNLSRFPRALLLFAAVVSLVTATLCFRAGNWTLLLAMWLGLAWSVRGIAHAVAGVWDDDEVTGRGKQELFGLVTLAAGVVIAIAPFGSIEMLAVVAGGGMTVFGVLEVWTAARSPLAVRSAESEALTPDEHLTSVIASAGGSGGRAPD
ncbi:HdeD family acid-resistance protein [Nocardia sp. NPDC051750]|uniref:HdeD family acid-resistance protein n=1 Tax=Nocardia sp. NPDC051750 TaxID=3364325 RepID=UPI0037AB39EB